MDIGRARQAIEAGERVARFGWNGKGMYLIQLRGLSARVMCCPHQPRPLAGPAAFLGPDAPRDQLLQALDIRLPPTTVMRTADGAWVAWLCSQSDLLADDWIVLGPEQPW